MNWKDSGGGGDFEKVPTGTHVARCIALIDLGTEKGQFGDKRKVMIRWELPLEKQKSGDVFTIGAFYTQSLHEKATLRSMLKSWRGRDFTEEELAGFDPRKILGQPCMLGVIETKNAAGELRHVVGSVAAIAKGVAVPDQINPSLYLSLDPGQFNAAVFEELGEKMQERIKATPEWDALHAQPVAVPNTESELVPF